MSHPLIISPKNSWKGNDYFYVWFSMVHLVMVSICRIKSIRNKDNKISGVFSKELNKWALESIAYLALDRRLGCLQRNLPDDSTTVKMIQLAEDVFTYSAKLDFRPSPWKYIATPTFKKTMKLYDEQTRYASYDTIIVFSLLFQYSSHHQYDRTLGERGNCRNQEKKG